MMFAVAPQNDVVSEKELGEKTEIFLLFNLMYYTNTRMQRKKLAKK